MSGPPRISIVTANYNGARFIAEAVRSVLAQTIGDWELIIIDDASSDDSLALAEAAAGGDDRVRLIRQSANGGPAAARNRGLDLARGDWIAVFDSDDAMAPNRLELLLVRAEQDRAQIVADNLMVFGEDLARPKPFLPPAMSQAPCWIDLTTFVDSNRLHSRLPDLGYLKPMIRADLVRTQRYDETLRIGEDYQFLARLLARGHRLRLEPRPLYRYRKHPGSISHRISEANLRALIAAEARFAADHPHLDAATNAALARRRRSLETLLAYEHAVQGLKSATPSRGAVMAMANPRIWPLLTGPLKTRLARLVNA